MFKDNLFFLGFRERGWVASAFPQKPQEVLLLVCNASNKPGECLLLTEIQEIYFHRQYYFDKHADEENSSF